MSRDDPDGFVSRWSRLKQDAKAEPDAGLGDAPDPLVVQAAADAAAVEKTDADLLAELELPDPDAMNMGDDFSVFMSSAVPTRLRNRALRRLWRSNPMLANLDNLLEYGEDFTAAATAGEVVQTAYQVGRGFVRKATELLEEDVEDGLEADQSPEKNETPASPELEHVVDEPVEIAISSITEGIADPSEKQPSTSRKAMRFTFDDDPA